MKRPGSFVGLDIGTSGCRALAIDDQGIQIAEARVAMPEPVRPRPGSVEQDPECWWQSVQEVLSALARQLQGQPPIAIGLDATSGTLLLADADGRPIGPALMYDDRSASEAADRIARLAPADSPARGPGSSLAKAISLAEGLAPEGETLALHQSDWITGRLTGRYGLSDWNNALKLGYETRRLHWPDWVRTCIPGTVGLPRVLAPGAPIASLDPAVAARIGFPPTTLVLAGTTDSTAAVMAAGAACPGDAVTSLGSTLVIKVVSERPVGSSRYGIYSHRFGDHWLVGGASNSGGRVLRRFFDDREIAELSRRIDPETDSGLDYYPLPGPGERFPHHDPKLEPRLEPRPSDPARFLHGLLEGIAVIEAEGYARLAELGAPAPTRVLSVGGGARNTVWTRLRARRLGIPVIAAEHQEAAFGMARLARETMTSTTLASHPDPT
ncbi:FGGY-family carbohydrate kinase [Imhoffiella purpurea]|uniref:Carbohydrate kinase, FGGY family n=1 Tax=Imhoffiella purpurea TaxID=1249627 RepID=W9VGC2_9GAMM|nr:FGGY-family carbohydrate kinase [Imhoffiella purpurea]EXJ15087.1 Carbohydrate kinase, FGGY family [Imhoffiella purpurea]